MHPLLATARLDELAFIAALDYGQGTNEHLAALKSLIFERQCKFRDDELWYPYEVIELGTNSVIPGHEREFAFCCLLALAAINSGFDTVHDRESKFAFIEPLLDQIPDELAALLLEAYIQEP